MKLYTLCLGNLATNCYMVTNEETKECIIIDPAAEFNRIDNTIKTFKLKPAAVLLTHAHFDHVLAMPEARDAIVFLFISRRQKRTYLRIRR